MKSKMFLVTIMLFFAFSLYANEVKREYYDDAKTKLKSETSYNKDGKKDGVAKKYYENGKLQIELTFKNDKPVGMGKAYEEDGTYCEVASSVFLTGIIPEGETKCYYSNGNVKEKIVTKKGKSHHSVYTEDGNLEIEMNMINGEHDGEYIKYYDNGHIKIKQFYSKGKLNGSSKLFYDNDVLAIETFYKNDKKEGEEKFYDESKELYKSLVFKNDVLISGKCLIGNRQITKAEIHNYNENKKPIECKKRQKSTYMKHHQEVNEMFLDYMRNNR